MPKTRGVPTSDEMTADDVRDLGTGIPVAEKGAGLETGHPKTENVIATGTEQEIILETGIVTGTMLIAVVEGNGRGVKVLAEQDLRKVCFRHQRWATDLANYWFRTDIRLDRDRDRPRHRSRSRSPVRNGTSTPTRTRSPPKAPRSDRDRPSTSAAPRSKETPPTSKVKAEPAREDTMQIDSKANGHTGAEEDENSEDALLRKMMGFSAFKSTQNQKIPGNNVYGVRKEKSTKYRQYMNRTGGFNRPLSPSRD